MGKKNKQYRLKQHLDGGKKNKKKPHPDFTHVTMC